MSQKEYDFFAPKAPETPTPKKEFKLSPSAKRIALSAVTIILLLGVAWGGTKAYHSIFPPVYVLEKAKLDTFSARYSQLMSDAHVTQLRIERKSQDLYTVRYMLADSKKVAGFNFTPEKVAYPAYNLLVLTQPDNSGIINYVEHNEDKSVDLLNSPQIDSDMKLFLGQIAQTQKDAQNLAQAKADEEVLNNINETKKIWGDLYEPAKKIMLSYELTHLEIKKGENSYNVTSHFKDNTDIQGTYDFTFADTTNILNATYDMGLNIVDYKGHAEMVSEGFGDMRKNLRLDATRAENEFMPELNYAASRARQSKMWNELNAYTEASYSKQALAKFIQERPYKAEAQKLINRLLSDMYSDDSIYQGDKTSALSMLSYVKAYDVQIDAKRVCNAYNKMSDKKLTKLDKEFFKQALGTDPESVCK